MKLENIMVTLIYNKNKTQTENTGNSWSGSVFREKKLTFLIDNIPSESLHLKHITYSKSVRSQTTTMVSMWIYRLSEGLFRRHLFHSAYVIRFVYINLKLHSSLLIRPRIFMAVSVMCRLSGVVRNLTNN